MIIKIMHLDNPEKIKFTRERRINKQNQGI
jgi:hypothetical protein